MKILLPSNDAIDILSERLNALSYYPFNPTVWQKVTVIDIDQIFGTLSNQSLSINHITFETPVTQYSAETLKKGIEIAKGLLNSYIQQIARYSEIELNRQGSKEFHLQRQINELIDQRVKLQNNYAALNASNTVIKKENDNLQKQLKTLQERNQYLIDNKLQSDNVTLKTIWRISLNTPLKKLWPVIGVLISLLIIFFTIGLYWHRFFN